MSRTITHRELRNDSGAIIREVQAGETDHRQSERCAGCGASPASASQVRAPRGDQGSYKACSSD